jgi:hydrogenase nickel incorporation protein HypA/HybF
MRSIPGWETFRGVVKEALRYSYTVACEDMSLEGSQLVIKEVPVEVYCPACEAETALASV